MRGQTTVTVVSIHMGIITLIRPNGTICYYRQLGIPRDSFKVNALVSSGLLDIRSIGLLEIPKSYKLVWDSQGCHMGRPLKTFRA